MVAGQPGVGAIVAAVPRSLTWCAPRPAARCKAAPAPAELLAMSRAGRNGSAESLAAATRAPTRYFTERTWLREAIRHG